MQMWHFSSSGSMSIADTAAADIDVVVVDEDDLSDNNSDSGRAFIIGLDFSEHVSLVVRSISDVDDAVAVVFLLPVVKSSESWSSNESSVCSLVCILNNSMDGFMLTFSRNGFIDDIPELPGNSMLRYFNNSSASSDCWCNKLNMRAGSMAADVLVFVELEVDGTSNNPRPRERGEKGNEKGDGSEDREDDCWADNGVIVVDGVNRFNALIKDEVELFEDEECREYLLVCN